MISILPAGFAAVVEADLARSPAIRCALGNALFELLFVIDVQIGTVGYLLTMRPLDAHIRSGNPYLAGWLAALMCYPPFVSAHGRRAACCSTNTTPPSWGVLARRAHRRCCGRWAGAAGGR